LRECHGDGAFPFLLLKPSPTTSFSLYELRVEEAQAEGRLQLDDAEDRLRQLQQRAQEAIATAEAQKDEALSRLTATGATPTAAIIENESLQAQLDHSRDQLLTLEDQLQEARSALRTETESARKRKDKYLDTESKLRAEIKKLKSELGLAEIQAREAKDKVEELHEVLEQRSTAQEAERFELEALRAEAGQEANGFGREMNDDRHQSTFRATAEVKRLTSLLEQERSDLRQTREKLDELEKQISTRGDQQTVERSPPTAGTVAAPNSSSDSDKDDSDSSKDLSQRVAELETALHAAQESAHDLERRLHRAELERAEAAAHSQREVADLEALIEVGMWQREELEAKVADLEKKLQRAKEKVAATRRAAELEVNGSHSALSSEHEGRADSITAEAASKNPATGVSSGIDNGDAEVDDICDDCGSRDHTLDNCPLLDQVSKLPSCLSHAELPSFEPLLIASTHLHFRLHSIHPPLRLRLRDDQQQIF
jgi:methyl-accepting chemotaxis protein